MVVQTLIFITTCTAIWLSQDSRDHYRKWSPIFGIASQPFWFYTAYQSEQWGVFATSILIAAVWCRGLITHWTKGSTID